MQFKKLMSNTILAAVVSLYSLSVLAADPLDNLPPGAKIITKFNSAAPGYRGVLFESGGKKRVFYATPDNKNVIYGVIYDASGNNITTKDMIRVQQNGSMSGEVSESEQKNAQKIDYDTAFLAASKTSGYVEGSGANSVYVYFDPNCPHCHKLWTKTKLMKKGSKIHWIPVAGLRSDSLNKGAELINNPSRETMEQIANDTIAANNPVSTSNADKMEFNMGAMAMTGSQSFPTILYVKNNQKKSFVGMPDDQLLLSIFGK